MNLKLTDTGTYTIITKNIGKMSFLNFFLYTAVMTGLDTAFFAGYLNRYNGTISYNAFISTYPLPGFIPDLGTVNYNVYVDSANVVCSLV